MSVFPGTSAQVAHMAPGSWRHIMQEEYFGCCGDPITALLSAISPCCVAGCISSDLQRSCICSALFYLIGCYACHRAEVQRALGVPESSCCVNCVVNASCGCCIMSLPQSKRAITEFKKYNSGAIVMVPAPMQMGFNGGTQAPGGTQGGQNFMRK